MSALTKFHVTCWYLIASNCCITLPVGKTTDDIAECYIRYGSFRCTFKDGSEWEQDMGDAEIGSIDFKYPREVDISEVGNDETPTGELDTQVLIDLSKEYQA